MTARRCWENLSNPIAVLSAAPARPDCRFASVLTAVLVHGVVLAVIGSRMLRPLDIPEVATIDVIEVVTAPQVRVEPGPMAVAAEPTVSEPPLGNPVRLDALDEPVPSTSPVAPETPRVAEQAELAEAPRQPAVTAEAMTSIPPVAMLSPAKKAAPTKVFRPAPVPHAGMPAVTPLAAAKPEVNAAGQPAAAGEGTMDHVAYATLTGRIRNAVQAAVQCPTAARMMGQSGRAAVAFKYRDGALVGGLALSQSSGMPLLDAAALAAVRNAHYPKAPPDDPNEVLHLLVWVDEACGG